MTVHEHRHLHTSPTSLEDIQEVLRRGRTSCYSKQSESLVGLRCLVGHAKGVSHLGKTGILRYRVEFVPEIAARVAQRMYQYECYQYFERFDWGSGCKLPEVLDVVLAIGLQQVIAWQHWQKAGSAKGEDA